MNKEEFMKIWSGAFYSDIYGIGKNIERDIFDKDLMLMGASLGEWWEKYNISMYDEIEMLNKAAEMACNIEKFEKKCFEKTSVGDPLHKLRGKIIGPKIMIKFKGINYRSKAEETFAMMLDDMGITFVNEYEFDTTNTKKYRFDFAILDKKIAIEVEGIGPKGKESRHQRFLGYMEDCEKYNLATLQGWQIYRIPSPWITSKKYSPKLASFLERFNREMAHIKP